MAILINLVIAPWSLDVGYRVLSATITINQLLTWGLVFCLVRQLVFYGVNRVRFLFRPTGDQPLRA